MFALLGPFSIEGLGTPKVYSRRIGYALNYIFIIFGALIVIVAHMSAVTELCKSNGIFWNQRGLHHPILFLTVQVVSSNYKGQEKKEEGVGSLQFAGLF